MRNDETFTTFDMAVYKQEVTIWKFVNALRTRALLDPLTIAYLSLCSQVSRSISLYAVEIFKNAYPADVFKLIADDGPHYVDIEMENLGVRLGMWKDVGCKTVRTHTWINQTATYTFVCVRRLVCKDIACMIAHEVARMYVQDIVWLKQFLPTHEVRTYGGLELRYDLPSPISHDDAERMIRERISVWNARCDHLNSVFSQ